MKKKGLILNSNLYKDNSFIVDMINENELFVFEAKGISKSKSKNKSLLFFLNLVEAEFASRGEKNILINGNILYDTSFLMSDFEGIFFLNVMKEILYKLFLKENIYKYYDKLLNLLYLCGKYKSSNIYLIAVIHFLIYVFDKEGIDYLSYLKENSLDTTTIDSFLDFKDLSNIILSRETLKNILKNLNLFIVSNLNTKLNSIELL